MDLGLTGKVAVVAGASAGIGKAIAAALSSEGVRVAILSRSRRNLDAAVAEITQQTEGEVMPFVCDVRVSKQITTTFRKIRSALGAVEILVCNAGGPPLKRFEATTERDWDNAYSLNLKSTVLLCKNALPDMRRQHWGRILCITSVSALQASETLILSSGVRPAIHGLVKALSNEVAADGITVNAICPGYTATERLNELAEAIHRSARVPMKQVYADWKRAIPAGRLAQPEELGALAAFLVSERASYLTGVAINIDGGFVKTI